MILALGWYLTIWGITGLSCIILDCLEAKHRKPSMLDPLQVEALLELDAEFPQAKVFPIVDIATGQPFTGI